MLAMPWIATGVFVYQSFIADSKMWSIYTIPKAFMVYSIASIVTLFPVVIKSPPRDISRSASPVLNFYVLLSVRFEPAWITIL